MNGTKSGTEYLVLRVPFQIEINGIIRRSHDYDNTNICICGKMNTYSVFYFTLKSKS